MTNGATENGTLFFVHRGHLQPYLIASILQARSSNPRTPVVLLSDQPLESIPSEIVTVITLATLSEFSANAQNFEKVFRFEGTNSFEYELMNFQRWFYVQEFCDVHSISVPLMVLDSDAYLYLSLDTVTETVQTDMTVVDKVGPQFTYFRSPEALTRFTGFLLESFLNPEGYELLRGFVRESGDTGVPHVSDMAAFGAYAQLNKLEDLGNPNRRDFVFCENIGSPQGLATNFLGKKIISRRGRRHFTTREGRAIVAGGVHLQGGNKDLWPYFVDFSVKQSLQKHSPRDYAKALRVARQKAFRIGLLKIAARSRKLFTREWATSA